MDLLIHNDFSFQNILKDEYKVLKDQPDVINKVTMANGSVRRNYRQMSKTTVKIKFGQLDRTTYRSYISHFMLPEDDFTFYDTHTGLMATKRFAIDRDEDTLDYISEDAETHGEFGVTLTQIDDVEVQNDNS